MTPQDTQVHNSLPTLQTDDGDSLGTGETWETELEALDRWLKEEAYASDAAHDHHHHDVNRHDDSIRAFCVTYDEPLRLDAVEQWFDLIMLLKIKELLITLMDSDPEMAAYFGRISSDQKPSVRSIMEKNFCFNLKLEEYADLSHRSLSTFKREFQQLFDEAPGKWLRKRRVQHAAGLIENTGMSLSQIALESGFEDLSHFSRVFKDTMGEPPSSYRKAR